DVDSLSLLLTENSVRGCLRKIGNQDCIAEINSINNFPPVVGDINRDDKLDVIVLSGSGEIYVWDIDGNILAGFPVYAGDIYSAPALGDIDDDGYLEIIFCGDNKLYAYNYNGTPATNFPVIIERVESIGSITSAPILADLNGDGKTEIIFGSKDNRIFALQGDGYRFNLFPLTTDGEVVTSGIVLNDSVNNTGDNINYVKRDIFFKSKNGLVYGYTLDFSAPSWEEKTPWLMYGYNSGHTNSLPKTLLPEVPIYAELMPEKAIYNYPNPANDETTIRYFLSRDAAVNIKFFDLSGDLVAEANQTGKANTENEFKWDCSRYASGVYLCRVEAKSNYGKQVGFCKIALVK
ncbi:MAG: T9SS type A sorting domain-containing protein, partial [candidate division Zixibacteria bacterium]|nr:T9SS type A sorting domain-containing protein [candidate division Zixibacteria bacterium]